MNNTVDFDQQYLEQDIDLFLADLPEELIALSYSSQFGPSLVFRREEPIIWPGSDLTSDDVCSATDDAMPEDVQIRKLHKSSSDPVWM